MVELIQSILVTGPSGVGKSTLARSALAYEGSGFVVACPGSDELDSYYGLQNVIGEGFDDLNGAGYRQLLSFIQARLGEVMEDKKEGKPPRYKVAVFDTISGNGQLAYNATLRKFGKDTAPPALSPDGAAFYSYLRSRQEETASYFRALKGCGVHIIALSHIGEGDVTDANIAKDVSGTTKVYTPLVPGGFKQVLPSYFSTVLAAGVGVDKETKKRYHYVNWRADGKRMAKSRLGDLSEESAFIRLNRDSGYKQIKDAVEAAAAKRLAYINNQV